MHTRKIDWMLENKQETEKRRVRTMTTDDDYDVHTHTEGMLCEIALF